MTAALGNTAQGTPFATGVDAFVYPQFLGNPLRPPTTQDIYNPGTRWQDNSVKPAVIYTTTGAGNWDVGDSPLASNTIPGNVYLSTLAQLEAGNAPSASYVPSANDVFTFVNSVAISGGTAATTAAEGFVFLATNAQAVTPGTVVNPNTVLILRHLLEAQPQGLEHLQPSPHPEIQQ